MGKRARRRFDARLEQRAAEVDLRGRRWMGGTAVRVVAGTVSPQRVEARDRRRAAAIDDDTQLRAPIGRPRRLRAADGTPIHVRVLGKRSGPTFVLTHGLCCDHRMWAHTAAALAEHGTVVVWDLRGHGRTPLSDEADAGPLTHATDLATVIAATARDEVILVSHSLGGMSTLQMLIEHPDVRARIDACVLVATPTADITSSAIRAERSDSLEARATRRLFTAVIGNHRIDRLFVSGDHPDARTRAYTLVRTSGFGLKPHPAHVDLVHEMIASTPVPVRQRTFAAMISTDLRPRLPEVDVPTLVITGGRDRLVNPVQTRRLANALPNAAHVTFAGAGHAVVLERHASITRRILLLTEQVRAGTVDLPAVASG